MAKLTKEELSDLIKKYDTNPWLKKMDKIVNTLIGISLIIMSLLLLIIILTCTQQILVK